jgi:hypothetical protein
MDMSKMKDIYSDLQDLVYDAIEAGAKTDEDVYAFVITFMNKNFITLQNVKDITELFAEDWA